MNNLISIFTKETDNYVFPTSRFLFFPLAHYHQPQDEYHTVLSVALVPVKDNQEDKGEASYLLSICSILR